MGELSKVDTIKRGHGSPERPLAGELWDADSFPGFPAHRATGDRDPVYDKVDYRRYYDRDYARLEHDRVLMKSWLKACREEDLPEVGARLPVQVGPVSFFVVRTGEDSFKAFHNSCTHRGTQLCWKKDAGAKITCPYHAWEFALDGTVSHIPSHWDFKMVSPRNGALKEVALARWGGFIFINADPDATDFDDFLGVLPSHFEIMDMANRYTAGHWRKLVKANWKLTQEAFMESYHVVGTHANAIPFSGDTQSQYDIFLSGRHAVGRQLTPGGHPSMHAAPEVTTAESILGSASFIRDMHFPDAALPEIDPARPVRAQVANWFREQESKRLGRLCTLPDGVVLDSALYFMFAQSCLWLSEGLPFSYSFFPHESDPELSYMEVRMLKHYPEGATRPQPAERVEVGPDESVYEKVAAFGFLGTVFDQDFENLPRVQIGVRSASPTRNYAQLGSYQEFVIKQFHELLDERMAG